MEILFLGNLKLVSPRFFDLISKEHECVAIKRAESYMRPSKAVKVYNTSDKLSFDNLMLAHHFDAIIFFAYNLDNSNDLNMEFEHLHNILSITNRYGTKLFFYVRSNEPENINEGSFLAAETRNIVDSACEELCKAFQRAGGMIVRIIRLPYVYSTEFADNKFSYLMKAAIQGNEIVFRANLDDDIDSICEEDLGTFLMHLLDDPLDDEIRTINLGGGNHMTYGQLAHLYSQEVKRLRVSWLRADDKAFLAYKEDETALKDFGWRPFHRLENDMPDIKEATLEEIKKEEQLNDEIKDKDKMAILSRFKYPIDLIIVMGMAELLTRIAPDRSYFSSWDIRLIAVLLLGMTDGTAIGIVSGVIASLLYIISIAETKSLLVLLKEPGMLVPIVFFILIGNISGYLCDKKNDEIDNACKEAEIQNEQCGYLNKLYDKTRETRESFQNQILGFRNSYGRIYALLKRIEDADEHNMFAEAVACTEEIMETSNVAIYKRIGAGETYDEQAHSMMMSKRMPRTVNLRDFPDMYPLLKNGETFVNKALKEGYPAYAAAIRSGEEMNGFIVLTNADYRQMNMEYADKFSVVTGIISVDLVRTMRIHAEYENQIQEASIMGQEDFSKLIMAYCDENGNVLQQHSMLLIKIVNMSVKEAARRVSAIIRGDDVIGLDEKNRIILLLPNTSGQGVEIVKKKLKADGIDSEILQRVSV